MLPKVQTVVNFFIGHLHSERKSAHIPDESNIQARKIVVNSGPYEKYRSRDVWGGLFLGRGGEFRQDGGRPFGRIRIRRRDIEESHVRRRLHRQNGPRRSGTRGV